MSDILKMMLKDTTEMIDFLPTAPPEPAETPNKGTNPPKLKKEYTPMQIQIAKNHMQLQTIPNWEAVLDGSWEPFMDIESEGL